MSVPPPACVARGTFYAPPPAIAGLGEFTKTSRAAGWSLKYLPFHCTAADSFHATKSRCTVLCLPVQAMNRRGRSAVRRNRRGKPGGSLDRSILADHLAAAARRQGAPRRQRDRVRYEAHAAVGQEQ